MPKNVSYINTANEDADKKEEIDVQVDEQGLPKDSSALDVTKLMHMLDKKNSSPQPQLTPISSVSISEKDEVEQQKPQKRKSKATSQGKKKTASSAKKKANTSKTVTKKKTASNKKTAGSTKKKVTASSVTETKHVVKDPLAVSEAIAKIEAQSTEDDTQPTDTRMASMEYVAISAIIAIAVLAFVGMLYFVEDSKKTQPAEMDANGEVQNVKIYKAPQSRNTELVEPNTIDSSIQDQKLTADQLKSITVYESEPGNTPAYVEEDLLNLLAGGEEESN